MANINIIQTSFTGGEISPRLLARVDLETYKKSAKKIKNAYSMIHGGLRKRPGTILIGEVSNFNERTKLVSFTTSRSDSYLLVFNDQKIQVIRNKQFIESSPGVKYELSTPYLSSELSELRYAQSGNVMFITHKNHHPKQLVKISETNWQLTNIPLVYDALSDYSYNSDYVNFKIISGTQTPFSLNDTFYFETDGNGNITTPPTKQAGFVGTGNLIAASIKKENDPVGGQRWDVTCTIVEKDRWTFSVVGTVTGSPPVQWSAGNYPNAVTFFNQRLILGGSTDYPQYIWGSSIFDYSNFTTGPLDSDAFSFQIASNKFDEIIHLEATRQLIPLTFGGEFSVGGSSVGITPSTIKIEAHTFHGTSDIKPLRIGQELLFVQRDAKKIRAISYDINIDSNVAPDITVLAEHITQNGLKTWSFAQDPDYLIWAVKNDGVLLSLSHDRDQAITSWTQHDTDGLFKNVETIPDLLSDITYVVVERNINGQIKHFIEYFDLDTFTDASIKISSGTAITQVSGLELLEGKLVNIVCDGKVHATRIITAGSITLDYPANEISIGLPFTTEIELLHPEIVLANGTSQGSNISIRQAVMRLQDTIGLKIDDKNIPIMTTNQQLDVAPNKYTGDITVNTMGWNSNRSLKIQHDIPAPFQLLGVILKVATGQD